MAPSCALDADGLRRQRDRYRTMGVDATVIERSPRRLVLSVAEGGAEVVPEVVEVESECCPFFDLAWDPGASRFSISVSESRHEPALDAIEFALGVEAAS